MSADGSGSGGGGGGSLVVGLSIPKSQDAAHLLQAAREDGFDYVTTNLPQTLEPRTDVTALESRWWRTSVVGRMDELNSPSMEWAHHMSIPAVLLPEIPPNAAEYSREVASMALISSASNGQVWIRTKLSDESLDAFDALHRCCDGANNVGMMLTLNAPAGVDNPVDMIANQMVLLHKAIGSQLKAICLPTSIFLTNKKGYPALSKTHQVLFSEVLRRLGRTIRILIEGPSRHTEVSAAGRTQCLPYLQYILHMRKRPEIVNVLDSPEASMEEAYLDQLQRPLQPLADQLEFQTYETFEKDPIKYHQYQKAISACLANEFVGRNNITILVVGAGRGPLVRAALVALTELQSNMLFHIYAVEKNPSAIVYLESLARHDPAWKSMVTVIHSDMRLLSPDKINGNAADLVISELLGSFGDNELSPECLDGLATTGLWTEKTVSIPAQYSAYLAPVSSMRLHSEARAQSFFPLMADAGLDSSPMGSLKAMETPYVVRTHAASQVQAEQLCWTFQHPNTQGSHQRAAHLVFPASATHGTGYGSGYGPLDAATAILSQSMNIPSGITIHGFVGTFEATLYGDIMISTRPQTFSDGMFSWFPLYFPLREPLRVPPGASIRCDVWRRTETGRVWYEWCAQVTGQGGILGQSAIHNPNGRSCTVRL